MPTPKIEMRGVTKSFGSNHVLRGVDLMVHKGQSMVIIGGSGTGKSVTLKCVLGMLPVDKGQVFIDGDEVTGLKASERDGMLSRFGMLFQGGALFDSIPVWENVAFGLIQGQRKDKDTARERAVECLRQVGLTAEVGDRFPAELSGGMQKRVGLARAIATQPEIIFFDEPTTGLDPIMADVINSLIVEAVQELGATTMTITHDMASVRKVADRVAMLHEGQIIWEGPIEQIDESGSAHIDQFINGRAEGPIEVAV